MKINRNRMGSAYQLLPCICIIINRSECFTKHDIGIHFTWWNYHAWIIIPIHNTKQFNSVPRTTFITSNERILNVFFRLYLYLSRFGKHASYKNTVYDHLGAIDTLGYRADSTRFTRSFSEEMGSYYEIKLTKRTALRYLNYEDRELYMVTYPKNYMFTDEG